MRLNALNIKKASVFIQFSMIFTWVSHLIYTDSYFSVYALCAALAVLGLWDNYQNNHTMSKLPLVLNLTLASLLSLATSLANYPIFQRLRNMEEISVVFLGNNQEPSHRLLHGLQYQRSD